ncbi:MAG: YkgJ family cysteine cluster protein [Candidatus Thorarchaeota archaeon]
MPDKMKYSFKCLEKECASQSCHYRPQVRVTFGDISRWTSQNLLSTAIGGIGVMNDKAAPNLITLAMYPIKSKERSENTVCIMFNEKEKTCKINQAKPISCRTYPLEYDGEKYYLSDKTCDGIGKGEITKDALKDAKELAEQDYNERMYARYLLPALYNVIMNTIALQQEVLLQGLSKEDREQLEMLLAKGEPDDIFPEKPKTEHASSTTEAESEIPPGETNDTLKESDSSTINDKEVLRSDGE